MAHMNSIQHPEPAGQSPPLSYFRSVTSPQPFRTSSLRDALDDIHGDTYRDLILELRDILVTKGEKVYKRAKTQMLPAYTFGGTFTHRGNKHLIQHSGIIHADIDNLDDAPGIRARLMDDPHLLFCFVSPSEHGLKLGVWVNPVEDDATYKKAWHQVAAYFQTRYQLTFDPSRKDISGLCFVSWDPHLYYNPEAIRFYLDDRRDWYAEHAIKTAVEIIDASRPGNRHDARIRASNLLGGYVGGGIVGYDIAYIALEEVVRRNTDDFDRSMRTISDGLDHGQGRPFSLEQLEAEREAWRRVHQSNGHRPALHTEEDGDEREEDGRTGLKPGVAFGGVLQAANGYYRLRTVKEQLSKTQISSFVVEPTLRIWVDGSEAVRANIQKDHKTLAEVTIERHCWHSRGAFLKVLTSLDQWCIATDNEIQAIQAMVAMQKVPSKRGTRTLGLVDGVWVSDEGVFDQLGWIADPELVYLPMSGESPLTGHLRYRVQNSSERPRVARAVYDRLWKLNELTVIGALIGWFFSTPFKPSIHRQVNHFPILNVWGTMGAGKTSLLRLFWKLFGIDSELFACTDTEFSLLSLLSATSSIPLVFDEFKPYDMKPDQVRRFERVLRRVYDGDTEHRGRPDLRLITYRLMAPVAVAGEVSVARQPAMRERIIPVSPSKTWLPEHEDARKAYWELVKLPLHAFASLFIEWSLRQDFSTDWVAAEDALAQSVDREMPERIRDGLRVVSFGLRQFEQFGFEYGLPVPEQLDLELDIRGDFGSAHQCRWSIAGRARCLTGASRLDGGDGAY